jgi:hypothetical protein
VTFATGSWISHGRSVVSYTISRNGRTVAHGTAGAKNGSVTLHSPTQLRAAHYTLTIILKHNHQRILLTRAITLR